MTQCTFIFCHLSGALWTESCVHFKVEDAQQFPTSAGYGADIINEVRIRNKMSLRSTISTLFLCQAFNQYLESRLLSCRLLLDQISKSQQEKNEWYWWYCREHPSPTLEPEVTPQRTRPSMTKRCFSAPRKRESPESRESCGRCLALPLATRYVYYHNWFTKQLPFGTLSWACENGCVAKHSPSPAQSLLLLWLQMTSNDFYAFIQGQGVRSIPQTVRSTLTPMFFGFVS